MKIRNITVCHLSSPVCFFMEKPVFSWTVESDQNVLSYRIVINEKGNVVFDSGRGQLDSLAYEADLKLKPRTRYDFVIEAETEEGIFVSEPGYFETGKMGEPFAGKLITTDDNSEKRHPVFVKHFNLDQLPEKARLYISACGLYEVRINGKKISEEHLTPYCTAYDEWIQIITHEVSDLCIGENTIEIILGNGWYRGRFGFDQSETPAYGDTWKVIGDLVLSYEDHEEVISTDESWDVARSNIIFSNIYDGEIIDDTLDEMPLTKAVIAEEEKTSFLDRLSPPVLEHEIFKGRLIHTSKNETVFDIGQNMAGSFRLRVHEPKGTKIHLQFSEVMQDECFYRDNLRTAKAEYIYISDGEEHIIEPHFTFYGYRFVKVEGVSQLKEDDFEAYALYSDFPYESVLVTGNEKINRLIKNAEWGMKSNYLDVPTDCPQRDERMGWTGDAMVFSPTALYLGKPYAFLRKYLFDMAKEQEKNGGLVPFTIPSFHIAQTACVWGDATVIIPWNMYRFTGDLSIIKEHYPAMKSWIEWIRKFDGDTHNWERAFHFGDWLALDGPQGAEAVKGATDDGFVAEIYYRKSCLITADCAELLGKNEEGEEFRKLADEILEYIRQEYYTPSGRCAVMTQTAQVLSVMNQIGDDEKAKQVLMKLLDDNEGKLATGFVGTPLLCEALTRLDLRDYAFSLLFNEEYPGWLYEVNLGATTIWERWNSIDETGHITGIGMNSLNHYSYGSIVEWIYSRCAGIMMKKPGFREAVIAPFVHHKLHSLHCIYPSAAGTYEVDWNIKDVNHIRMKVSVPYGAEADIVLPYFEAEKYLGSSELAKGHVSGGCYEIEYETERPLKDVIDLSAKVADALRNEKIKEYLEKLPLFKQTEFSMRDAQLRKGLAMISIVEESELSRIEKDLFALQMEETPVETAYSR